MGGDPHQALHRSRRGVKRPPLRTFCELAEHLGLKPQQLAGEMSTSPIKPPQPELRVESRASTSSRTYYIPGPFLAWWKAHNEAKGKT